MSNQELLECIVGYLPYNVKGVFLFNGKKEGQIVNKSKTLDLRTVAFYMENSDHIYFKPILRPLSDLTKPCLEGGKVPIVELAKSVFDAIEIIMVYEYPQIECLFKTKYGSNRIRFSELHSCLQLIPTDIFNPLDVFKFMYKHHFDIHGLIKKRYAIDINTLK